MTWWYIDVMFRVLNLRPRGCGFDCTTKDAAKQTNDEHNNQLLYCNCGSEVQQIPERYQVPIAQVQLQVHRLQVQVQVPMS